MASDIIAPIKYVLLPLPLHSGGANLTAADCDTEQQCAAIQCPSMQPQSMVIRCVQGEEEGGRQSQNAGNATANAIVLLCVKGPGKSGQKLGIGKG
jgi:hypothetical protein